MANHRAAAAAALLLIASLLVAVALSGTDASPTVRRSSKTEALRGANVRRTGRNTRLAVRRDAHGRRGFAAAAPLMPPLPSCSTCEAPKPEPMPKLTCNKVHGVQAGETCYSVGLGAGLTLDDFLGFNPNVNCYNLFVGQWVCLSANTTCA